ncbi:MAG: hypothetical protein GY719_13245 [bacterium]|nr:hypothetical protein [bacterium]
MSQRELQPHDVWLAEDPPTLEKAKEALLGLVADLTAGLARLPEIGNVQFVGITKLDEWVAIENEADEWTREVGKLRPAANLEHVKESLISVRGRISELIEGLAIRTAVRDPFNQATNSTEAEKNIAGLLNERHFRTLGQGLLEQGASDPWEKAVEALEASVIDWSTRLGPEHRVQLERLCHKLLEHQGLIAGLTGRSAAVKELATAGAEDAERLEKIYARLVEVPDDELSAGLASDFHYMAFLAKKIVERVQGSHQKILNEHAGGPMPAPVAGLFRLLHLKVPRIRTKSVTQTFSRRELELAFGRRLWKGAKGTQDE